MHEPIPISGMRTSLLIFEPPYKKPLTPIKNILAINPFSHSAPRRDDGIPVHVSGIGTIVEGVGTSVLVLVGDICGPPLKVLFSKTSKIFFFFYKSTFVSTIYMYR